jgi:hypothetical protein
MRTFAYGPSDLNQRLCRWCIRFSDDAAAAGGLDTAGLERRTLELRGKDQQVDAWVARVA